MSFPCHSKKAFSYLVGVLDIYEKELPDMVECIYAEIQRRIDLLWADDRALCEGLRRMHWGSNRSYDITPPYDADPQGWMLLAEQVAKGRRNHADFDLHRW